MCCKALHARAHSHHDEESDQKSQSVWMQHCKVLEMCEIYENDESDVVPCMEESTPGNLTGMLHAP